MSYHQQGPQYPQQPHYPQQPGFPMRQTTTPIPPGRPKKRAGRLVAVIIAVVVVVAGAGGVWLWQSGGSSPAAGQDLPQNASLKTLAFPDPDALRYGDGVEAMCGAVEKVMTTRGYVRISEGITEGGINCRSITPGLSVLTEGAIMMSADVAIWRDEATSGTSASSKPVGATSGRTDTEAVFRSGDDIMWVAVWGNINHVAKNGESVLADPLTEEITYREISGIVMSLSGEGQPGEPQITKPNRDGGAPGGRGGHWSTTCARSSRRRPPPKRVSPG